MKQFFLKRKKHFIIFLMAFVVIFVASNCGSNNSTTVNNNNNSDIPGTTNDFIPFPAEALPPISSGSNAGEVLTLTIAQQEYRFRWVPGGTFLMGAPSSDTSQFFTSENVALEAPQHSVTLSEGFWLLETELSQLQWHSIHGTNPSEIIGKTKPVVNLSYEHLFNPGGFMDRIHSQTKTKNKFFVPTEAQWEYAARAGTSTIYYWGDTIADIDLYCWYTANSSNELKPVGQLLGNNWGLKDMLGNAYELVNDYSGFYSSATQIDPTGPVSGSSHVFRGGSFKSDTANCRVTNRILNHVDKPYNNQGVRIGLKPD